MNRNIKRAALALALTGTVLLSGCSGMDTAANNGISVVREETGAEARELIDLGDYYGSPAIMGERIRMFLARGLTFTDQHLDEDEFLEVFRLPLDEAVRQIMNGEIPDGKTQTAILRAAMMLKK